MSAASGEGSIWREMEIGRNMARNTAICSSAGCVRQNGMPEWSGLSCWGGPGSLGTPGQLRRRRRRLLVRGPARRVRDAVVSGSAESRFSD
ncbi:Myosin-Iiib [Manis pentadactyla]|nr:Myosin-Iiib [Manis pentadactyla]